MGYPVAYRNGASAPSRILGSQGVSDGALLGDAEGAGSRFASRVAANDNFLFAAANDNMIGESLALRGLGRFVPLLGMALIAWDVWNYYNSRDIWAEPYGWFLPPGWVKDQDCGLFDRSAGQQAAPHCGNWVWNPNIAPVNQVELYLWTGKYLTTGLDRGDAGQHWHRVDGSRVDVGPIQDQMPFGQVEHYTSWLAHTLPVQQPVATPWPLPWALQPYQGDWQWTGQSSRGYNLRGRLELPDDPDLPDQGGGKQDPDDPPHETRPPRRGEKEKKFTLQRASDVVRLFNFMTEARDFVSGVYYSLPKADRLKPVFYKDPAGKWRKRKPNLYDMSMAIYEHVNDIDMAKAVKNVMINEIQDYVFGRIGRANATAARKIFDKGYGRPATTYTTSRRGTDYGNGVPLGQWLSDNWPW